MKNKLTVLLKLSIILLMGTAFYAQAEDRKSYPMVCKVGVGSKALLDTNPSDNSIYFYFQKSAKPATAGVSPGSCAWLDRGISTSEPDNIKMKFPGTWLRFRLAVNAEGPPSVYRGIEVQGPSLSRANANAFYNAFLHGREFQLHVYSDGNSFIMTRLGP